MKHGFDLTFIVSTFTFGKKTKATEGMHTEYDTDCGYALLQLTRDNITNEVDETRSLGIALCTRGTARVMMNVGIYDLCPNSILIIPPNSMM